MDGLILTPGRRRFMAKSEDRFLETIDSEDEDSEVSLRGYEILTYPADFTLEVLVGKWKKREIKIPKLQRRFIWTQAQSSKLIESFLMGLPVPPVFFYQDRTDNKLLVIDGQQRLRTIVFFFSGLFGEPKEGKKVPSFNLTALDEKSPYAGTTYQQLMDSDEAAFNKLQNSVLRSFVMKQLDPADDTSIFQVFERLNTGGVVLQGQEVRNCIYEGALNNMLIDLNKYPGWRKIIGKKSEDKRMRDMELILRFLALRHGMTHYKKPMKKFLNDFMKDNRNPTDLAVKKFSAEFQKTADAVVTYLGDNPFHIYRGLNVAAFDSTFTAFGKNLQGLAEKPTSAQTSRMRARYDKLKTDTDYVRWIVRATTDDDVVPKRIKKAEEILFS